MVMTQNATVHKALESPLRVITAFQSFVNDCQKHIKMIINVYSVLSC